MLTDWKRADISARWIDAMRSHGDSWRQELINPVVIALASAVSKAAPIRSDFLPTALARHRQARSGTSAAWHKAALLGSALGGLRVVDLGCGEGYLARWLASFGADCLGLDGSAVLVDRARSKAGTRKRLSFATANLDKDLDASALAAAINRWGAPPRLALVVAVIEHLSDPAPLLAWIREILTHSNSGDEPGHLLLVALNWDYFDERAEDDAAWNDDPYCSRPLMRTIASIQREVQVQFWSRRGLGRLCRDAGLNVVSMSPLFFAVNTGRVSADSARPTEPNLHAGIPPFVALVARPKGRSCATDSNAITATLERLRSSSSDAPPAAFVKQLAEQQGQLELVSYRRDDHVLTPYDMGGDLYVVVRGSLGLMVHGKIIRTFATGQILGDLETAGTFGDAYYPYPIIASDDSDVLRVPARVAGQIIASCECTSSYLFRQLRNRLIVDLWGYNFRAQSGARESEPAVRRDRRTSDRVARVLLGEVERLHIAESNARPELSGFLLCMPDLISRTRIEQHRRLRKRGERPNTAERDVHGVLGVLLQQAIVDAFPGTTLRSVLPDEHVSVWRRLVSNLAARLLVPAFEVGWAAVEGTVDKIAAADHLWWEKQKKRRTRALREIEVDFGRAAGTDVVKRDAVRRFLGLVWAVNLLWHDEDPAFYLIRDFAMLRAIALDDDTSVDLLFRARRDGHISLGRDHGKYLVLLQEINRSRRGRLDHYIAKFERFVAADALRAHPQLCEILPYPAD